MMAVAAISAHAQKYALVDMEYILRNIPAYERANEQLNQVSRKWQAEVEALNLEASTMYKNYQNEVVFLSQEQKKAKQDSIMQKEKEASDLKKKYFCAWGELSKRLEALMGPIQEEIYNAVKEISNLRGYSLVLDRASNNGIIFFFISLVLLSMIISFVSVFYGGDDSAFSMVLPHSELYILLVEIDDDVGSALPDILPYQMDT